MYDLAFAIYEKDGLDRATALAHWRTTHADLVARVPGVRRYLQSDRSHSGALPFLGIAILSFDDEKAFEAARQSEAFAAAVADLANFADAERLPTVTLIDPLAR